MFRRSLTAFVAFAFVLLAVPLGAHPAAAAPSELFFSEYIEGSSNNKALEIYNGTGAAIDLGDGGYNVQMFFNGNPVSTLTINLTGTVAAGDVFVLAQSASNATILAQADQTNGSGWFNGDDAVVLRKSTTVIDVIGQIGLDPGTEWGTGLTSTADNTLRRKTPIEAGDTDGSNPFDPSVEWDGFAIDTFAGLGFHPGTAPPGDPAPSVASSSPSNGAAGVALDANITITFSEAVVVGASWYAIGCTSSGSHAATASGGPTVFTLDATTDFAGSETCTVTVFAAQVADQDSIDPPDNMAADFVLSFGTIAPPTRIHTIQGASHRSPLEGTLVLNVPGIVTAKTSNGFFIQDPAPDANPATSEAIFVFTNTAPAVNVGDAVSAKGTVQEFRPGGAGTINLTTTELGNPSVGVTVLSSGNALPATVVIGADRTPPTEVIEDDAAGNVETTGVFDPGADGIDFWESLEAMRLQLNDAQATGPRNGFGEISVVTSAAGIRTTRGGIVIRANDYNPERLILDDVIMATPTVNTGDTLSGATVGVLDYNFGNFKLLVTSVGAPTSGGIAREVTAAASPGQLAVATFNVENLDAAEGPAKFDALAAMIINNLRSPDILALEEIQDNNGPTNDTTVDASLTLARLRDAVAAAGGPIYQWRLIDPIDDQDGGEPGGNIRQAFFFRTDRGVSFVDRPGGTSTTATTVVAGPGGPHLSVSPGRVDPTNPAFINSRKPLVGEFMYDTHRLFVVANHFNSKGGDDPLFGYRQPPILSSEAQRNQQATVLAGFVSQILTIDANALVAVIGDLNDFEFSRPLTILESAGLTTLIETLPQSERYSYVFDGNSQTLDHMQVSNGLRARLVQFDSVHANSEFADQISDHDPQAARFGLTAVTTDSLCSLVESMVAKEGIASALCAKLEAAAASEARGNANAKAGQIGAFINQINAQRGKSISDVNATRLIDLAEAL
jgi:predicted extracellular nuclease